MSKAIRTTILLLAGVGVLLWMAAPMAQASTTHALSHAVFQDKPGGGGGGGNGGGQHEHPCDNGNHTGDKHCYPPPPRKCKETHCEPASFQFPATQSSNSGPTVGMALGVIAV
ncbi:MAG: hypothetical protein LC792_21770, partial [Actinobacteria bacterium]|nr:hypothetical protein [Actinomycetota bacterium]